MSFTFNLQCCLTIFAILSLVPRQTQADDVDFKREDHPVTINQRAIDQIYNPSSSYN